MGKNQKTRQRPMSPERFIRERGRSLEIEACYLDIEALHEYGEGIGYVVRRHMGGNRTVGVFLIDKWCLGVKDVYWMFRIGEGEFSDLMEQIRKTTAEKVPYEVLHNWIFGAVEFAYDAGIAPHKDFSVAKYLLEDDEDERIPLIEYDFGDRGQYHLCVQTREEAVRYLPVLHRTLGDGFLFTVRAEEREEEEGYGEFDEVPPPPYSYRHPDYPSACVFRCKALERLLTGPDEVPSDQEVRRILSLDHEMLRQDLEGFIWKVLHDTADITMEEAGDDGLLLILALLLLGEAGDNRSLDVVLEVMRQSEAFRAHHFGDWADAVLVPVLAALCSGSFDKVYGFLEEPGLEDFFRTLAVPGICTAMYQHPEMRAVGVQWLRRVLKLYTAEIVKEGNSVCSSGTAGMLVSHIIDARAVELAPEIRALYATGKVDLTVCGSLDEVLDELRSPDRQYYKLYSRGIYELLNALR